MCRLDREDPLVITAPCREIISVNCAQRNVQNSFGINWKKCSLNFLLSPWRCMEESLDNNYVPKYQYSFHHPLSLLAPETRHLSLQLWTSISEMGYYQVELEEYLLLDNTLLLKFCTQRFRLLKEPPCLSCKKRKVKKLYISKAKISQVFWSRHHFPRYPWCLPFTILASPAEFPYQRIYM